MTEPSNERDTLADITPLATVLSHSAHAFAEELVGSIARALLESRTLLPDRGSVTEETADNGAVIKRFVHYHFDPYLGAGEEIPVIDELQAILDIDEWASTLLSKYHLPDNGSLRAFCASMVESSAVFLLKHLGKVGEFDFDVDDFPPRFGSGSSRAVEYELEGSPHSSWDERGVAEHFLSLCADELRGSALLVVYEAFVRWVPAR